MESSTERSYTIIKYYVKGSRELNNIFWAFISTLGGWGFLGTGLSSFLKDNVFFLFYAKELVFIPQGIILMFYGTIGVSLGLFLWSTIWWNVGFGYNEFDKNTQKITLYRKGFPGKNSEIFLEFKFKQVKSIKMLVQNGLSPKRQLLLCLKDGREIPLINSVRIIALSELETQALVLAYYLEVFLESS